MTILDASTIGSAIGGLVGGAVGGWAASWKRTSKIERHIIRAIKERVHRHEVVYHGVNDGLEVTPSGALPLRR